MAGEGRATEADEPRLLDAADELARRRRGIERHRLGVQALAVEGVGVQDEGGLAPAVRVRAQFDPLDRPGDRGVQRGRDEPVGRGDHLPAPHALARTDERARGGARVLGQREHVGVHERHALDGQAGGRRLQLVGVHAVAKGGDPVEQEPAAHRRPCW